MANENCLKGFVCPLCGSEGPFKIEARMLVKVWDDGTDDSESGDVEWDEHSYCECCECYRYGTVGDFTNRSRPRDICESRPGHRETE